MKTPNTTTKLIKDWCQQYKNHPQISLENEHTHFTEETGVASEGNTKKDSTWWAMFISDHKKSDTDDNVPLLSYLGKHL